MNMMTDTIPDAVYALAQTGAVLYAARFSGLYRSRDGGATWTNTFSALEADPKPAATAVAASGQTVLVGVNGAVLRSQDGGQQWTIVGLASPLPHVVALALSPQFATDGVAAAGTSEDGVFITGDAGQTWVAWNFGLLDLRVLALAFSPDFATDKLLYAASESGIFRSHNGGRSWREVDFPMRAAPVLSLAVVGECLYAGTESHGLMISRDGGQSWITAIPAETTSVVSVSAANGRLHALTESRLLRSADEGQTWETLHSFPDHQQAMALTAQSDAADSFWVGCAQGDLVRIG